MNRQLGLQVAANLLSLAVAIWLGWSPALILLLFWAENIVVALWQLPRILLARGGKKAHPMARAASFVEGLPFVPGEQKGLLRTVASAVEQQNPEPGSSRVSNLFVALFFLVHYGLFTFAHGALVFSLFLHQEMNLDTVLSFLQQPGVQLALLGMMISHGYAFFGDLASGRLNHVTPENMMGEPYHRILVLHLVVMGSAFLLQFLPWPMIGVVLLTAVKILMDLHAQKRQNRTA